MLMTKFYFKILVWQSLLTQIQFDIQNGYAHIDILSTGTVNSTLINPSDLQYLLHDIKGQLQSHPQLDLPTNIEVDVVMIIFSWTELKFC